MIRMKIAENNPFLAELQFHLAKCGQGSMPSTADAMNAGANSIRAKWQEFAMGGNLDGVEKLNNPSSKYARSIRINRLGPFQYEIFSEAKIAQRIEEGTPEHDMKLTHPFGPRSRVSKEGVPYLIIPLRWGTPKSGFKNIMPESVYSAVKKFKKMKTLVSADKSTKQTPNEKGQMVGRAQYNRGFNRLKGMDINGTIEQKIRMDGMVRSTDDTGKDKSGGYFTFRVISAKSPASSWIRKEQPPRPVTKAVADYSQKFIGEIVNAAILEDLGL
jgi:hypothetical protein